MGGVRKEGLLQTEVDNLTPVPVSISGTATITGSVAVSNAAGASAVNIQDGGNSITVDAPVAAPVFVRLSDGAAAISTLPVSLASVPSHNVTNTGTFAVQADTELPVAAALADTTANPTITAAGSYNMTWNGGTWDRLRSVAVIADNTGLPTQGTLAVVNFPMLFDGAAYDRWRGDSTDGALVNLGTNNDVTVTSGTITSLTQMNGQAIAMGTGVRTAGTQRVTIATDDVVPASQSGTWNIGTVTSLTQMNGQAISMGTGVRAAGTQRVTIATDDLVPISDNGGSITVDGGVTISGDVGVADQFNLTNSKPFAVALVDTNGDQISSFGGGTQYTEDLPAAANPVGTAVNLVRQDTPATLVSTDGDNVAQRGTNYGAGYVQVVTSAGAFVDTFGGGTQYADGAVRGTATGTLAMGDDGTNIQSVHVDSSGDLQVDVLTMPTVTVQDGGGSITVDANNLDIRDLVFATDKVDVSGSTLAANSGVDIGDVTINNAAGAAAVNIQDGGNSITIDATALPLPTGAATSALQTQPGVDIGDVTVNNAAGASAVNIQDGGNSITIDAVALPLPTGAATSALQTQPGVDIGDVTVNNAAGAAAVNIQDGGNSITVDGTVAVSNAFALETTQVANGVILSTIATNTTGIATASAQTTAQTSFTSLENATRVDHSELMQMILVELRTIGYLLQAGLNVRDEPDMLRRDFSSPYVVQ